MTSDTTATDDAVTSGSDTRPSRTLRRPVLVDVAQEAATLLDEPQDAGRDRNSRTIATTDRMRITLTALRAGAEMGSEETNDTLAVQALEGELALTVDGMDIELRDGQLATVESPSPWTIRATTDAVLLITVALGTRPSGG